MTEQPTAAPEPTAAVEKLIDELLLLVACNYYERQGYDTIREADAKLRVAIRQLAGDKKNAELSRDETDKSNHRLIKECKRVCEERDAADVSNRQLVKQCERLCDERDVALADGRVYQEGHREICLGIKEALGFKNWPEHRGQFRAFVLDQVKSLRDRLAEYEKPCEDLERLLYQYADSLGVYGLKSTSAEVEAKAAIRAKFNAERMRCERLERANRTRPEYDLLCDACGAALDPQ